jgi:hypothetical protein
MDEHENPGVANQYRTASPWPVLVAVGFAITEVGVFLGVFAVAVGGVLLLGASTAGILRESGYVRHTWRVLAALGGGFTLLGVAIVATQGSPLGVSVAAVVADPGGVVGRGVAVAVAGVMLVAAGATGGSVGTASQ